jgi:hypothetical protein
MSQGHQGRQRVWNRSLLAGGGRWAQWTSAAIARSWGWWDRLVRSARLERLARWPASRWLRSARRMIAQARVLLAGVTLAGQLDHHVGAQGGVLLLAADPLEQLGLRPGSAREGTGIEATNTGSRAWVADWPLRWRAAAMARWRTAAGLRAGMPRPWRVKAFRSDGQVVSSC